MFRLPFTRDSSLLLDLQFSSKVFQFLSLLNVEKLYRICWDDMNNSAFRAGFSLSLLLQELGSMNWNDQEADSEQDGSLQLVCGAAGCPVLLVWYEWTWFYKVVGEINGRKIHQEHFPSVLRKFLNLNWCSLEKYKGKKKTHLCMLTSFFCCFFNNVGSCKSCANLLLLQVAAQGWLLSDLLSSYFNFGEVCPCWARVLYAFFHVPCAGSVFSSWFITL